VTETASTPPLVGRAREAAVLTEALEALADGISPVAVLTGEPGIGKTRLLEELAVEGERRGHLVLAARAAEVERELPFGVVIDALDPYLASLDRRRVERLAIGRQDELAALFPSLQTPADPPTALSDERYRTHRAVRLLLERLATPVPLVLVLDDVH
jgi:predicted ATPase